MQLCLAFDNRHHLPSRDRDKNTEHEQSEAPIAVLLLFLICAQAAQTKQLFRKNRRGTKSRSQQKRNCRIDLRQGGSNKPALQSSYRRYRHGGRG
jgi:hypothetical protein